MTNTKSDEPAVPEPEPELQGPERGGKKRRLNWYKILGPVTLLGFIGFLWSEYGKCEDVRQKAIEGHSTAKKFFPDQAEATRESLVVNRSAILDKIDDLQSTKAQVDDLRSIHKVLGVVNTIVDSLCKAELLANGVSQCSIWSKSESTLSSTPKLTWQEALTAAGLPSTSDEAIRRADDLNAAVGSLRKIRGGAVYNRSCDFYPKEVGETIGYFDRELRQENAWIEKVFIELHRFQDHLKECIESPMMALKGGQTLDPESVAKLDQLLKERQQHLKSLDSDLKSLDNGKDSLTLEQQKAIEAAVAACSRTLGICAAIAGVRDKCSQLSKWYSS